MYWYNILIFITNLEISTIVMDCWSTWYKNKNKLHCNYNSSHLDPLLSYQFGGTYYTLYLIQCPYSYKGSVSNWQIEAIQAYSCSKIPQCIWNCMCNKSPKLLACYNDNMPAKRVDPVTWLHIREQFCGTLVFPDRHT